MAAPVHRFWVGCLGLAIVLSLPSIFRALRARRAVTGPFGVWEGRSYAPVPATPQKEITSRLKNNNAFGYLSTSFSVLLWSPLGVGLNLG
jgi:ferric-chelate reductase